MEKNRKILVIEDEEFAIQLLHKMLTREGYEVSTAMNKREAQMKIANDDYDLIISDIMLPYSGGFDILEELQQDERKKDIPVLVVTGMDKDILQATKFKANACFTKPYDINELLVKVKELLPQPA